MSAPLYLALDGGGSGCRALLADQEGRIIGRGQAGPANINSDREAALAEIMIASTQALAGHPPAGAHATLGLAGAEIAAARAWLAPRLPFARARILHDAVTATAGALGPRDGIVAAIGTGSVFSRQTDGEITVIGGRGPILGDEAGGAWLGRLLLSGVLRAADGVAAMTPLAQTMLDRMGGIAPIVAFAAIASAKDFAEQARHIADAPEDPLAEALLTAAEAQIAAYLQRLQPTGGVPLPIAFTGGLGALFAARMGGRWNVIPPQGAPLDGALRLALEGRGP